MCRAAVDLHLAECKQLVRSRLYCAVRSARRREFVYGLYTVSDILRHFRKNCRKRFRSHFAAVPAGRVRVRVVHLVFCAVAVVQPERQRRNPSGGVGVVVFTDDIEPIIDPVYGHGLVVARDPRVWNTAALTDLHYQLPRIGRKVGIECYGRFVYNPVLSLIFLFRIVGKGAIVIRCSGGQSCVRVSQRCALVDDRAVVDARRRRAGLAHDASADKTVVLVGVGRCPR